MRIFTVLSLGVLLASCDGSLMSQSERDAIAELACTELRATYEDQSLQRLRIVNAAREKLGGDVFLGDDDDIERYLRWETCEQFLADSDDYFAETTRREQAYSLIERNADSEEKEIEAEYFSREKYLVSIDGEAIDTATMSGFSGDFEGIKRLIDDEDDKVIRRRTVRSYIDGRLDGLRRDWHLNGQLASQSNYIDGGREGLSQSWHLNGQKEHECEFVEGYCEGVYRGWYENGQLQFEFNYVRGDLEGLARVWHTNGQLSAEANFLNDEQDGVSREWDKEGNLTKEVTYVNGVVQ